MQKCVHHVFQREKMYWLWQVLKMTKADELYVNAGVGFTGRGGSNPWGWLETKWVSSKGKGWKGRISPGTPFSPSASQQISYKTGGSPLRHTRNVSLSGCPRQLEVVTLRKMVS